MINRSIAEIRRSPLVRETLKPLRSLYYRRTFYYPPPRVLANSLPKAGTHLLSTLLGLMPKMTSAGVHDALDAFHVDDPTDLDWTGVEAQMGKVRNGQFATGHFPALPDFVTLTRRLGLRVLVMFRDPRDIMVSYVYYVLNRTQHSLHRRFVSDFPTFDERLSAMIAGMPPDGQAPGLPSVAERLDAYLPWTTELGVHTCRFEDIVGRRGGGDVKAQQREIAAVGEFVDRPLSADRVASIADRVWSPQSTTFRRGMIGDWRNHFNSSHVEMFKELAGHQLIELGYENDTAW